MSIIEAMKLARQIADIGDDAAPLLVGLVNKVRGEDPKTQRIALDAAFAAAEQAVVRRIRMQP